jgi:hypothetical protein
MKTAKTILNFYFFGIIISLILIGSIHLYSLIFENHFKYAQWSNMVQTIIICGIPFGLAIWGFDEVWRERIKLDLGK